MTTLKEKYKKEFYVFVSEENESVYDSLGDLLITKDFKRFSWESYDDDLKMNHFYNQRDRHNIIEIREFNPDQINQKQALEHWQDLPIVWMREKAKSIKRRHPLSKSELRELIWARTAGFKFLHRDKHGDIVYNTNKPLWDSRYDFWIQGGKTEKSLVGTKFRSSIGDELMAFEIEEMIQNHGFNQ